MSGPCTDCGGPDYQTLVARIVDLEEEVQHQVERREEEKLRAVNAEAEVGRWSEKYAAIHARFAQQQTKLEQAEACRDALQDRRCGTCGHALDVGSRTIYRNTTHHPCPMPGRAFDSDFDCNRWQPRGGGEG